MCHFLSYLVRWATVKGQVPINCDNACVHTQGKELRKWQGRGTIISISDLVLQKQNNLKILLHQSIHVFQCIKIPSWWEISIFHSSYHCILVCGVEAQHYHIHGSVFADICNVLVLIKSWWKLIACNKDCHICGNSVQGIFQIVGLYLKLLITKSQN